MGETAKKEELICVPGQRLCLSDENTVSGEGTYERHGYIYSLLAGVVRISEKEKVTTLHLSMLNHKIKIILIFSRKLSKLKH